MKFTIDVKETAKNNVVDAFLFYESRQAGLGERFLSSWEERLELIKDEPHLYQKKYKDFRQVLIKPFPYLIIYEVEEAVVVVYKVIYAGRNPRKIYTKK